MNSLLLLKGARMLGGVILFLGLLNISGVREAASATEEIKDIPCEVPEGTNAAQAEKDAKRGGHMVFGEVLRVDGTDYVVKDKDGKEVRLQTDQRTEKPEIKQGDNISANVDKHNHAMWIRSNESTDRRSEHASAGCNPS